MDIMMDMLFLRYMFRVIRIQNYGSELRCEHKDKLYNMREREVQNRIQIEKSKLEL